MNKLQLRELLRYIKQSIALRRVFGTPAEDLRFVYNVLAQEAN